jgi:transposase-like protein
MMLNFEWTAARLEAAQMVADGELTFTQIAEKLDISRQTLSNWRDEPEFSGRVQELVEEYDTAVKRRGIARATRRIDAQNDRWRRTQKLLQARAESLAGVPGGDTGLLVRTYKIIGTGDKTERVEEYAFDAALYREIRELEKQTAQELGQWVNKAEVGGTGVPIQLIEVVKPDNADDRQED